VRRRAAVPDRLHGAAEIGEHKLQLVRRAGGARRKARFGTELRLRLSVIAGFQIQLAQRIMDVAKVGRCGESGAKMLFRLGGFAAGREDFA
jgi:hypothetical protein